MKVFDYRTAGQPEVYENYGYSAEMSFGFEPDDWQGDVFSFPYETEIEAQEAIEDYNARNGK
jgi:hypothetical protein